METQQPCWGDTEGRAPEHMHTDAVQPGLSQPLTRQDVVTHYQAPVTVQTVHLGETL